ncbi:hypothetical protein HMPREF9582_02490 [Cutibacterium acnes HL060PA1]|nr:hypothetical protein HMPREF9582_02490 [Cutibacterium acnes HL060PA1]
MVVAPSSRLPTKLSWVDAAGVVAASKRKRNCCYGNAREEGVSLLISLS